VGFLPVLSLCGLLLRVRVLCSCLIRPVSPVCYSGFLPVLSLCGLLLRVLSV
jgi:hypothetical protein